MQNYQLVARTDAMDSVEYFVDEIVEHLVENGQERIWPLNDLEGFDEYHHSTHVDHEYNLSEAASILDQLDRYEETDSGLWQGLEPRRAISAQAAYTYGNAVLSMIDDILEAIKDDYTIAELLDDYISVENTLEDGEDNPDYEPHILKVTKSLKERVEQLARGEA